MMIVNFYSNKSDRNVLGKTLVEITSKEFVFKNDSSLISPSIIINYDPDIFDCNYFEIPELKRKYFIDNIIMSTGNKINIIGSVDVLESFKLHILDLEGIVINSEIGGNDYIMDSNVWKNEVRTFTEIKNFPHSLSTNGYFVLITVGGDA